MMNITSLRRRKRSPASNQARPTIPFHFQRELYRVRVCGAHDAGAKTRMLASRCAIHQAGHDELRSLSAGHLMILQGDLCRK